MNVVQPPAVPVQLDREELDPGHNRRVLGFVGPAGVQAEQRAVVEVGDGLEAITELPPLGLGFEAFQLLFVQLAGV